MSFPAFDMSVRAGRLVEERFGPISGLAVEEEPLVGGLESTSVERVTARFVDARGRRRSFAWVAKKVAPDQTRELEIHRAIEGIACRGLAPDLLASDPLRDGGAVLHLEWVRPLRRWPWCEPETVTRVTRRFAEVHALLDDELTEAGLAETWDYEAELAASAEETLEVLQTLPPEAGELAGVRRARPAARRLVSALPEIRRQLLAWDGTGPVWIHGDLHPGNVVLRRREGRSVPTLLDWARVRRGSVLEDLSSWNLSLCQWEPSAPRRHDRVLRSYLEGRNGGGSTASAGLASSFRDAYWLAAASNALSGALRYQLLVWNEATTPRRRGDALCAAEGWARAVRRADQRWRQG
ncbi:MAG TPA: phosphotransferase [Thermoanaerobaculia bacterium]|nr:phosphotransferase [Thermoanaerobaculia bacterium]